MISSNVLLNCQRESKRRHGRIINSGRITQRILVLNQDDYDRLGVEVVLVSPEHRPQKIANPQWLVDHCESLPNHS